MRTIEDIIKATKDDWYRPPESFGRGSIAGLLDDRQALVAEVVRLRGTAVLPSPEGEGRRSRRRIGEIEAALLDAMRRIDILEQDSRLITKRLVMVDR